MHGTILCQHQRVKYCIPTGVTRCQDRHFCIVDLAIRRKIIMHDREVSDKYTNDSSITWKKLKTG